ncbi:MAG TPA: DNA polymerase Y family protein [Streptosporangiaceae bacterium]|nr:DNA polymerase Y family protein [Streptosporangiaceae bacterium]
MTMPSPARVLVVRCPEWPAQPERAFEQVVSLVEELCPKVEVLWPGACAIGARGPARYFGGEEALAGKIIEAVTGGGFACQAGIADGLFAAQLAARAAAPVTVVPPGQVREFLAPYPVSVLDSAQLEGEGMTALLPRLGIVTLGDLARLPASQAVNRFGVAGGIAHRLARGLDPRPLAARPPSADLSVSTEFDPPAPLAEPVVFAAKPLAERMHAGLAARGLACVCVQVQVISEDGQEHARLWRHDGLLSALAVAERVRWQLAGWRPDAPGDPDGPRDPDEAHPGGITLLRLTPDQVVRAHGRQLGLWGDAVVSDRVARAALRVQAMLGHGAVTRPVPAGGRGPAEQATLVPFGDTSDPERPPDRPWPGRIPVPVPVTVCQDPLPARVTDAAGAPVTVTGRAQISAPPARMSAGGGPWLAITAWAGPWPVAERWWRPQAARRRARFQMVTEDGTAWLAAVQDGRWQIEARYD